MNKGYTISNVEGKSISSLFEYEADASLDHKGWTIRSYSAAGIDYAMLIAGKDSATFPLHDDPNEWFGYVVEGSGELHLGSETDHSETVTYQSGDIIIFKPNTYHGWKKNTSECSKLMFVKPSQ